ncbi:MAG: ATPase domain-containing protein [Candidatus Hermodarchaeota archaeon]
MVKSKKSLFLEKNYIISEIEKIDLDKNQISTNSKNFNNVIGGGFQSRKAYVVFGANKTGKTQLCHQLSVLAFRKSQKLIYLDTENTFRPERIRELAGTNNLDGEKVLKNILVSKIMSNTAFLLQLNEVEEIIEKNNYKMLIVDSINNYYRFERGEKEISFFKAKTTFLKILEKINELTRKYNLITILTAQVAPNFDENALIKEIPVGMQYLNHFFSEFLYLSYKEKDMSYIHLLNSHLLPEKKILYKITKNGLEDYKI